MKRCFFIPTALLAPCYALRSRRFVLRATHYAQFRSSPFGLCSSSHSLVPRSPSPLSPCGKPCFWPFGPCSLPFGLYALPFGPCALPFGPCGCVFGRIWASPRPGSREPSPGGTGSWPFGLRSFPRFARLARYVPCGRFPSILFALWASSGTVPDVTIGHGRGLGRPRYVRGPTIGCRNIQSRPAAIRWFSLYGKT